MPPLPTSTKDDYSTVEGVNVAETSFNPEQCTTSVPHPAVEEGATLIHYLKSIVFMPRSLRMVCLTNLFCWMAHVCYSLYFTDFVGEAVFLGDPRVSFLFECYLRVLHGYILAFFKSSLEPQSDSNAGSFLTAASYNFFSRRLT